MRPFDSGMMRYLDHRNRVMRARVAGDLTTSRRTVALIPVKWAAMLAAYLGMMKLTDGFWSAVCSVIVGGCLGANALRALERQQAYTWGWQEGRRQAFEALREAEQRGHSVNDWLVGEMERDATTLW